MNTLFKKVLFIVVVAAAVSLSSGCTTTYVVRSAADIPGSAYSQSPTLSELQAQEPLIKWLKGAEGTNKQEYEQRGGVWVQTPYGRRFVPYVAAGSRAGTMNPPAGLGGGYPCYNCGYNTGTGYPYNYGNSYWWIYR